MRRIKLIWQLYPSYLLITILTIVSFTWFADYELRNLYLEQTSENLQARAFLFQERIYEDILDSNFEQVDRHCKYFGQNTSTRFTVILPDGDVLGDTEEDPDLMEYHSNRPEIHQALRGDTGQSIRYSDTLDQRMMYKALPVLERGNVIAVVRASIPVTSIDKALNNLLMRMIIGGILILLIAAVVVYFVARRIARPLEELKSAADQFAAGDLESKIPGSTSDEINSLTESMNSMAIELAGRIDTIERERNEKDAVLSSMIEGVLAFDLEERIIQMNQAAALLLDADPEEDKGKLIHEVVRNPDLQNFVQQTMKTRSTVESDILLRGKEDRYLQVLGSMLHDSKGEHIGLLIVMNDVTRIKRLEVVRRDFVANVSHELRTPITSIKGFLETIRDTAISNTSDTKRFLDIAIAQTENLNTIIEDLLSLSRIERETERDEISLQEGSICNVLKSAIKTCETEASQKKIEIHLDCDENIRALIHTQLLEQAVINLLDNAIKCSPAKSKIIVGCKSDDHGVRIFVSDNGCGIAREHQSRIFERFYRVDKARSREKGGTGLGLAIVKHIAQAHRGSVDVVSMPGEGSTFSILIPQK